MPRTITYLFEFEDGTSWKYDLHFNEAHDFVPRPESDSKAWTKLEFHQCGHCPLKPKDSPQCPVARNLDQVVEDSKETLSSTRAKISVMTPERTYFKKTDTQEGLRSLFGMVMASSGCPHLDWLRPLARFHLPFSNIEETLFRVLSLSLLEGFLGSDPSAVLATSETINLRYQAVEKVNHTFVERIRSYCDADADKNAIAALDVFVQLFPYHLQNDFEMLRGLFGKSEPKPKS